MAKHNNNSFPPHLATLQFQDDFVMACPFLKLKTHETIESIRLVARTGIEPVSQFTFFKVLKMSVLSF